MQYVAMNTKTLIPIQGNMYERLIKSRKNVTSKKTFLPVLILFIDIQMDLNFILIVIRNKMLFKIFLQFYVLIIL